MSVAMGLVVMVVERDGFALPDGVVGPVPGPSPVVYFPAGCPDVTPAGWNGPVDYDGPHAVTVCPSCVASWLCDHEVGYPIPAPAAMAVPVGAGGGVGGVADGEPPA